MPNISWTEAQLLGFCDKAWALKRSGEEGSWPDRVDVGTQFHQQLAWHWSRPGPVRPVADDPLVEWLFQRYQLWASSAWREWEAVAVEVPVSREVADSGWVFQGVIDRVMRDPQGGHWLVETKTTGRRANTMRSPHIAMQAACYTWALQDAFPHLHGYVLEEVYTYRWKEERPVSESFRKIQHRPFAHELAQAEEWLIGACVRKADLLQRPEDVWRSVGWWCATCPWQDPCWGGE